MKKKKKKKKKKNTSCISSDVIFNSCWLALISDSSKFNEYAEAEGVSRLGICDGEGVDGVDMSGCSDERDSRANLRFFSGVTKS